jgi:hypothetical protein
MVKVLEADSGLILGHVGSVVRVSRLSFCGSCSTNVLWLKVDP